MAAWPAGLPQSPLVRGFNEKTPETLIRTGMDTGPPKVRQRFTAGVRKFNMNVFLTTAQVAILDIFIQTTLNGGSDSFTWKNHRTDAAATLRFISLPTYQVVDGNDNYIAKLSLEELP